jgi:hypothetical protein
MSRIYGERREEISWCQHWRGRANPCHVHANRVTHSFREYHVTSRIRISDGIAGTEAVFFDRWQTDLDGLDTNDHIGPLGDDAPSGCEKD